MLGRNHLATGVITGAFASMAINDGSVHLAEVFAVMAGSLLPDIDHTESVIGRRVKPVSWVVNKLFGHRGVTHSFWFPLFIFLTAFFIPEPWKTLTLFLSFGTLVHIAGDMMTVSGVPFFMPFSKKNMGLKMFRTGSVTEEVFIILTVFSSSMLMTWMFLKEMVSFELY